MITEKGFFSVSSYIIVRQILNVYFNGFLFFSKERGEMDEKRGKGSGSTAQVGLDHLAVGAKIGCDKLLHIGAILRIGGGLYE